VDDALTGVRRAREASAGWVPPPGAVWGGTPASTGPATRRAELVSHRDYHRATWSSATGCLSR
jgi:hypothetical protein